MEGIKMSGLVRWRCMLVAATFSLAVTVLAVNRLVAQSPDSQKPVLQDRTYVLPDTTYREPTPVVLAALEELNRISPKPWHVTWHPNTGLPRILEGVSKEYDCDAATAALQFVNENNVLLTGLSDSAISAAYSFRLSDNPDWQDQGHVVIDVGYKDHDISTGRVMLSVTESGGIKSVYNRFRPIELNDFAPTVTYEQVQNIIRQQAYPDSVLIGPVLSLEVYPSKPQRLGYRVAAGIGAVSWLFIVDAKTGEIISSTTGQNINDWSESFWREFPTIFQADTTIEGRKAGAVENIRKRIKSMP